MKTTNSVLVLTVIMQWGLFCGCQNRQSDQQADSEINNRDSVEVGIVGDHLKAVWQSLDLIDNRLKDMEREEASVSTVDELYGIAKNQFGGFPIVSESILPYLDGYKVKLMVGNLTTATFHGAKVKVTWGPPYEQNSNWSPALLRISRVNVNHHGSFK